MKYIASQVDDYWIIKYNDEPLALEDEGILQFDTLDDAQHFIRCIEEAERQTKDGVPE